MKTMNNTELWHMIKLEHTQPKVFNKLLYKYVDNYIKDNIKQYEKAKQKRDGDFYYTVYTFYFYHLDIISFVEDNNIKCFLCFYKNNKENEIIYQANIQDIKKELRLKKLKEIYA